MLYAQEKKRQGDHFSVDFFFPSPLQETFTVGNTLTVGNGRFAGNCNVLSVRGFMACQWYHWINVLFIIYLISSLF